MSKIINFYIFSILFLILSVNPAQGGFFGKSCDFMEDAPKPDWVSLNYDKAGYYFGVGRAGEEDDFKDQKAKSRQNALADLIPKISVKVESSVIKEIKERTGKDFKSNYRRDVTVSTSVSAKEELRDIKVRRWLDRKQCELYTIVMVNKKSVDMMTKVKRLKNLIARGADAAGEYDLKLRFNTLQDAKHLLGNIDFSFISGELPARSYSVKIEKALKNVADEIENTRGKSALAALNINNKTSPDIIEKLLNHIKSGNEKTERLRGPCSDVNECIKKAANNGYSHLILLTVTTDIERSSMGSFKGTLRVNKKKYNLNTGRFEGTPDEVFAQALGWTEDKLNWDVAAEKIIQSRKMLAGNCAGGERC